MQFLLTIILTFGFALSMLQCEKATTTGKSENAKNSAPTAASEAKANSQAANVAPTAAAPTDDAPRINLADAKKDFDAGNVVFVDTRAESAYRNEHIKGAINIPAEAFQTRYTEVPKGKKIIAYCS